MHPPTQLHVSKPLTHKVNGTHQPNEITMHTTNVYMHMIGLCIILQCAVYIVHNDMFHLPKVLCTVNDND